MRRFIYYDKDGIESYLAQITSGISFSSSTETTNSNEIEHQESKEKNIHSDIGAKLAGIGAEIQEDISKGETNKTSTNQLVKSLEEKVLSDYAFDKVFDFFSKNKMLKTSDFKIGDVVNLEENVTFFDFDYFEKLFSENGISSFSIKQSKDELKKIRDSLSGPQKQNIEVKNKIKEMENMIKQQESERKSTLEILNMAKVTLPYVRFVMTKECLIVLNDDCFRDNPNNIAFKYGGNIQIVGYVTNIIDGESRTKNQINTFSEMYKMVNQVMMSLYNGTKHVYVIHPLAMYY
mgnify:FL=1